MNCSALSADGEVLVFLNRSQQVQYASLEFFRQFGGGAGDLCGQPFGNLVVPDFRAGLEHGLKQLLLGTRDKYRHRTVLLRRSNSPLVTTLTATALAGSSSNRVLAIHLAPPEDESASPVVSLSEMSAKVLKGTAAGLTSEFLAAHLFISRQTVDYHIARMLRQFDMSNRVALIAFAYATGILKAGTWPPQIADGLVR